MSYWSYWWKRNHNVVFVVGIVCFAGLVGLGLPVLAGMYPIVAFICCVVVLGSIGLWFVKDSYDNYKKTLK